MRDEKKDRRQRRNVRHVVLLACSVAVLVPLVLLFRQALQSDSADLERAVPEPAGRAAAVQSAGAPEAGPEPEPRRDLAHPEGLGEAAPLAEEPAEPRETTRDIVDNLYTALERAAAGQMNPAAILEAALLLTRLEPDARAVPEPSIDGAMLFPLLDPPDRVQAFVRVRPPSRDPQTAQIIGLRIQLDPPAGEPYIVDGLARKPPRADFQIWYGPEGRPRACSILTSLAPAGAENKRLGLGRDALARGEGLYLYQSLENPAETGMKSFGIENGQPFINRPVPLALEGGVWPRFAEIGTLASRLDAMYAAIRER